MVLQLSWLQHLGTLMILALPVATAFALRRSFVASGFRRSFPELWVEGITMYLFGCAICAFVTMSYLKFVDPGILMRMTMDVISQLKQVGTPEYLEMARMLDNAVREGVVLNPSTFVISMFWMTMAIGSLTSMVIAAIVRIGKPHRNLTGAR